MAEHAFGMMWLGLDARTAMQRKRRDLSVVCEAGRRQSPHRTDAAGMWVARGTGSINRAEGRWGRKVET